MDEPASSVARQLLDWIRSTSGQDVVAGAVGSLVRTITLREGFLQSLRTVAIGAPCAFYGTPIAVVLFRPFMGSASENAIHGFAGFVSGIGGAIIVGWILDTWAAFAGRHDNAAGN